MAIIGDIDHGNAVYTHTVSKYRNPLCICMCVRKCVRTTAECVCVLDTVAVLSD